MAPLVLCLTIGQTDSEAATECYRPFDQSRPSLLKPRRSQRRHIQKILSANQISRYCVHGLTVADNEEIVPEEIGDFAKSLAIQMSKRDKGKSLKYTYMNVLAAQKKTRPRPEQS